MSTWPVNDDDYDPVLDACLAEYLGGETPPDLSTRILSVWQARQAASAEVAGATGSNSVVTQDGTPVRGQAVPQPRSDRHSSPSHGAAAKNGPINQAFRQSDPPNGEIRFAWPVGTGTRETAQATRSTSRQRSSRGPWMSLATMAATLVVGIGLGIAGLYLFGPMGQTGERFADTRPPTEASPQTPGETATPPRGSQWVQGDSVQGDSVQGDDDRSSGDPQFAGDLERPLAGPGSDPFSSAAALSDPLDQLTLVSNVNRSLKDLWERENVRPASAIAESEWLQRVFQFLLGREPDPRELAAFVSDPSPNKRSQWVERLHTESHYVDEYARFWAEFWTTNWLGHANAIQGGSPANREGFERYLEQVIAGDQSFQDLVFQLLAADGSGDPLAEDHHGATNFLLKHHRGDAVSTTYAVSRLLLGRRLDCAQCHVHPFQSEWTQQEFWELNAFFRQVQIDQPAPDAPVRLTDRDVADEAVFYEEPNGYQRAAYPVLPDGVAIPPSGRVDEVKRRELLGRWVADSAEFPRVVVNRVWAHFFGYGLVHPVDDMGPHNPPTDSELLDLLAEQFVAHQYSLRSLTQWIVLSDAFQRSSTLDGRNLADYPERGNAPRFSRFYLRPSAPIPTWDALQQLAKWRSEPGGMGDQARRFMARRLARLLASDPDRGDEGGIIDGGAEDNRMPEGILMLHPGVNRTEGLVLEQIVNADVSNDEIVRHLFRAAIGRPPEARELELARKMIAESAHAETVFQDIWWTLVNSQEFLLHP